jgi:LIVCS family branched-chain amino acid:cation transporter
MVKLKKRDVVALAFMTFALFVGAGNIIFPPALALTAGNQVWSSAAGFLLTGVGMPVLTIIVMARVGGSLHSLAWPLGKVASRILASVCYLCVGPFFATPRTATVSFDMGVSSYVGNSSAALAIYSVIYFAVVALVACYPGKILDSVGKVLAPIKILALACLCLAAFIWPAGQYSFPAAGSSTTAFTQGFSYGYLTMDTLAALIFSIVIFNAIRSRGISELKALSRYATIAALAAGGGLAILYLSLFQLGIGSSVLAPEAPNGAVLLQAFVHHCFGGQGSAMLTVLITVACFVTAIGLTCACAEYFSQWLPLSQKTLTLLLAAFSCFTANLGLTQLIAISEPALTAVYPPCITLIVMGLAIKKWNNPGRVIAPAVAVALLLGVVDSLKGIEGEVTATLHNLLMTLPLAGIGLGWVVPTLVTAVVMHVTERRFLPAQSSRS